jgi:hypothetical protein
VHRLVLRTAYLAEYLERVTIASSLRHDGRLLSWSVRLSECVGTACTHVTALGSDEH